MGFDRKVYDALSRLIDYPAPGYVEASEEWVSVVAQICPPAGEVLQPFAAFVSEHTAEQLEEIYCRTFDNTQSAALELGWHLYGEAYERGAFLVSMRQMLRDHNIPEDGELPDHASLALLLMSRCDDATALKLARSAIKPALRKAVISLSAGQNPYEPVLDAVLEAIKYHVQESNRCSQS
jgi:nitrate reductase assembly molybdenum cofactor insertion protein NarJ